MIVRRCFVTNKSRIYQRCPFHDKTCSPTIPSGLNDFDLMAGTGGTQNIINVRKVCVCVCVWHSSRGIQYITEKRV